MPLGLVTSEYTGSNNYWSQNSRRKIFYSFPNGTAPLTGFLSLGDTEETPLSQFGWYEERWEQIKTTTGTGGASTLTFALGGTTTSVGGTFTPTAGTAYRIYVADGTKFQQDDMITIHRLVYNSTAVGTTVEVQFRVTSTSALFIETIGVFTMPGVIKNDTTANALSVVYSGSAFAEGARSRTGRTQYPINVLNNTQIFKTAFELTRNALKAPLVYEKTGDYKNQLKHNGINHMAGMEWQFLTGDRSTDSTGIDPDSGSVVRRTTTGGLLWYLKQWEKGSVANGGLFNYRTSAVDVSAQTDYIAYPDKRIIRLGNTTVSRDAFDEIEALPFQKTNSNEFCKLCLCGPGYMAKVSSRYGKEITKTEVRMEESDKWAFKVTQKSGLLGDIYYKTHPLFSFADSPYRNSAFYIDLGYIKYRPLTDTDTDIQQMIQLPDADKRKDQYLTEAGLELPYPEAHMFVDQLAGIV